MNFLTNLIFVLNLLKTLINHFFYGGGSEWKLFSKRFQIGSSRC